MYPTEQAAASLNEEFGTKPGFEAFCSSSVVGMRLPGKEQKLYIVRLIRIEGKGDLVLVSCNGANGSTKPTKFKNLDTAVTFLASEARAHFSACD